MEFSIKLFIVFVPFFAICDGGLHLNTFGNHGTPSPGRNYLYRNDDNHVHRTNYPEYNEEDNKHDASFDQPDIWKSQHDSQKAIYSQPYVKDFDRSGDNTNHEVTSAVHDSSDGLLKAGDRYTNDIQMHLLHNSQQIFNPMIKPDGYIEDQKAIDILHNNKIDHNPVENNKQNIKSINDSDLNASSNTRIKKSPQSYVPQQESKKSSNKKVKSKKSKVERQQIPDSNVIEGTDNLNDVRFDVRTLHENPQQNFSPDRSYYNEKHYHPNVDHVRPMESQPLNSASKNPDNLQNHPLYIAKSINQPYNFVENQKVLDGINDDKKQHVPDRNIAYAPKIPKTKGHDISNVYENTNMINSVVHDPYNELSNKKVKGKKAIGDNQVNYYSDYNIKRSKNNAIDEQSHNLQREYTSQHKIDYNQNNPHSINNQKQEPVNLYPFDNIGRQYVLYKNVPDNNNNLLVHPDHFVEDQKFSSKHLMLDKRIENTGPLHKYADKNVNESKAVSEKQKKKEISRRNVLTPITEKKFFYQAQPVLPEPDRINNEETIYYIN